MGLLLNGAGNLVTKDMEKAEAANVFFASVFTVNTDLQESQAPETRAKFWSKELQSGVCLTLSGGGSD